MKEIKAYKCDYCEKVYKSIYGVTNHEQICKKNPDNERPCFGCVNLTMRTVVCRNEDIVDALYCKVRNTFLYPPKIEKQGNAYVFGEGVSNLPMPRACKECVCC